MKTNNEIIPFDFKGRNVRVIKDGNDNPWFIGKDVCKILNITKYRDAIEKITKEDKKLAPLKVDTSSQIREIIIINESGLYTLILRSNKPEAKEFKRWVTHDVLPSIRKYGGYVDINKIDMFIDTFFTIPDEERPMLKQMMEDNIRRKKQIEEQKPKVEFYEKIMKSDASFSMGAAAKILKFPGIGRNILFKILRDEGLLMDSKEEFNLPYQWTINKEWFEVSPKIYENGGSYIQVYVLPKGMERIRDILNK
jgi:anti-repressor protein